MKHQRTFDLYVATFQQHLHMEYISQLVRYSCDWVPIMTYLIEGWCFVDTCSWLSFCAFSLLLLYCLFSELWLLITPLVSSNFSSNIPWRSCAVIGVEIQSIWQSISTSRAGFTMIWSQPISHRMIVMTTFGHLYLLGNHHKKLDIF